MKSKIDQHSLINPKAVAFLIGLSVSAVTIAFLSLIPEVPSVAFFVAGVLAFSSSFFLTYVVLEFLFFKEINNLHQVVENLKGSQVEAEVEAITEEIEEAPPLSTNPLKRINQEISKYALLKEEEIDKLKMLENYRKEFLANVSHELKTPIFAAQGYILTLLDGAVDDEKVRMKFLKKAAKSLNGLDALVQDLLTLSQIESGVISMKPEVFDFALLVTDVYDQLEGKAKKRDIELKFEDHTDGMHLIDADFNRMNQVMINLIANAIKYHKPRGGWVKTILSVTDNQQCILVEVADNGLGIPEEHVSRVFERFYRVEKSRSKKQGGSGLGLAIVKHIIEGHNSTISIESEPNVGTSFQFKLPVGASN